MPATINQRAARDRLTSQPCPSGAGAEPSHLSCHSLAEYCNVPAAQSRNISHLSTFAVPTTIDQRASRDQLPSQPCSPGAGVEISRLSCRGIAEYRNVLAAQSLNISRFVSLETFALRHWDLHRAAPCCLTHPKLATTITMTKLDKPLPVIETPQHTWRLMRLMCYIEHKKTEVS